MIDRFSELQDDSPPYLPLKTLSVRYFLSLIRFESSVSHDYHPLLSYFMPISCQHATPTTTTIVPVMAT